MCRCLGDIAVVTTRPIHTVSFFNTMKRWGTGSREKFYSEMSNLRHLDLSRNKSLRTFETTAESVTAVASPLKIVVFTIASPMLLDVIITYRDSNIDGTAS